MNLDDPLIAAMQPLLRRVRTDKTAIKTKDGSQSWTKQGMTDERLAAHMNGGPARGVCPIREGSTATEVALLDFDSHKGEASWAEMSAAAMRVADVLEIVWGASPILFRSSGGRGVHLLMLWDAPQDAYSVREWLREVLDSIGLRNGTDGVSRGQVEIFPKQDAVPVGGSGNQFILPLAGMSVPLGREELSGLLVPLDRMEMLRIGWPVSRPVAPRERPVRVQRAAGGVLDYAVLEEALGVIVKAVADGVQEMGRNAWRDVLFGIHEATGGDEDGRGIAHAFSAAVPDYNAAEVDKIWDHAQVGRPGAIGEGSLRWLARKHGWIDPAFAPSVDDFPVVPEFTSAATATAMAVEVAERRGVPEAKHLCTDQANANRLVKAYGSRVLVAAGKWHVWDGVRWKADEADVYRFACRLSQMVKDEAAETLRRAKARMEEGDGSAAGMEKAQGVAEALTKWSVKCEMKGTIEAAVGLARKMLEVDAGLLDRDPWLLNVRNGVIDLRTGGLREHRAEDLITKLADVEYRGMEADAGAWQRVVEEICREDGLEVGQRHVSAFLRRWFGYCATGIVREQVFVVHWGGGSNGKSTMLETIGHVLGDYAGTAAPGLIASADRGDKHPTEIAALWGKRMVTAYETKEGVQLREDFVKQATGGDKLAARFMREDFFEFAPTHKLQLLTNSKPIVKGQDHGIWRRVRLVAYLEKFGSEEEVKSGEAQRLKDMALGEALTTEAGRSEVLAWIVRGAVEWARGGLAAPAAVIEASEAYRNEQDRVRQFVHECCELGEGMTEPLTFGMGGLFPSYMGWCKEAGFHGLARGRFLQELQRVVPGCRTEEAYGTGESGKRRKVLRVFGLRLLPE